MRNRWLILGFLLLQMSWSGAINGQTKYKIIEGSVTYKNANNIYVKFFSTADLKIGDSLFLSKDSLNLPSLVIKYKSSISTVCSSITSMPINIGDVVYFKTLNKEKEAVSADTISKKNIQNLTTLRPGQQPIDSLKITSEIKKSERTELLNGRLSVSASGDLDAPQSRNYTRLRVSNSLNITNIGASAFSFESYITYRHRYGGDLENSSTFSEDFKVYSLAIGYCLNDKSNIWLGRRLNPNISNMGAIDGLQYEHAFGRFVGGVLIGTRPDITDYGFNSNLGQAGLYLGHNIHTKNGMVQSSVALVEQHVGSKVDRRFVYFQHSNNLVRNLNLFLSSEMDLYQNIPNHKTNTLTLTSFYSSFRYRISKKISVSASYDNRKNIIYYETYKDIIEQLLEQETRQGLRFAVNYAPLRFMSINASTFLRFDGLHAIPTKNHLVNLNMNNILGLKLSAALSGNYLETSYLKGLILNGRIYRDFFNSKLSTELSYQYVDYRYSYSDQIIKQDVVAANLSLQIARLSTLLVNVESSFSKDTPYQRYYVTYLQRFKNKKKPYKK